MSSSSVCVLTPHGRRMNIKVQPNTSLLKVLEDVCQKYEFDPNLYDLRHHKRILDLTTMYRFSGLPNNAQLEMIEAQKKRQDAEVDLVIQLPDGSRVGAKFKPTVNLSEIVEQLCPQKSGDTDLVAVYMRTEITHDRMNQTTLKELGLTSGRAIIRLIHRDADAPKVVANVNLNLAKAVPKPEESDGGLNSSSKRHNEPQESTLDAALKMLKTQVQAAESSAQEANDDVDSVKDVSELVEEAMGTSRSVEDKTETENQMEVDEPMESDDEEGELHVLGERNAVVFSLNAAHARSLSDLPDSFFDLNTSDLRLLLRDLRADAVGSTEQPLLTSELRALEESKGQINKLNRYKNTIIRVQFPDRHVLQGSFMPTDTIETVKNFVRPYIVNADDDFVLFTTPPKTILQKEQRLFEIGCVPSAVLHFAPNKIHNENYLKQEVLEKVSSPKATLRLAVESRGLSLKSNSIKLENAHGDAGPSNQKKSQRQNTKDFMQSKATNDGEKKVPKWLKGIGK